jgi:ABC-type transport system substrate-binding protein
VTLIPGDPLNILDPYLYAGDTGPAYTWLRDEAPVYWDPVNRIWVISRYRDVLAVERDAVRYSSARGSRPLIEMSASMINRDDPRHQQQRKLLSGRFSPRAVRNHEPRVRAIAAGLISAAAASGTAEVVSEIAAPQPGVHRAGPLRCDPAAQPPRGVRLRQVPPTSVADLKKAGFVVRESPGNYFDDFIINSNPQQDASHKELLNPLLRQAFDDAIDRQAIVKTSLLGHGQPGSSIIPPATGHWYNPAVKPATFSLAKANALLNQAGYKMGSNGVRMANGHPMSYQVIMPADTTGGYGERSFAIIQGDFKKIGVQLNPKNLDNSAAYSAVTADHYRSFELSMWDWQPLIDPDFELSVLTCGSWNVWNDTGYCSKPYDQLYQAQGAAMVPAQRQHLVYQMQQMAATQRPYLVLDYADLMEAHSTHWTDLPLVGGTSWTELSKIPFESVHRAG